MGNNLSRKFYKFSSNRGESIIGLLSFIRVRYRVDKPFHLLRQGKSPAVVGDDIISYVKHGDDRVIINFRRGSYYYDYLADDIELSDLTKELLNRKYLFLDKITQNI